MPADLTTLFITATNTVGGNVTVDTVTNVAPAVTRFKATVILANVTGGVTTIPANSFKDDDGVTIGSFTLPGAQGYYNLFVNGVLQQAGLSQLTTANLVVQAALLIGVSVVVEIVDLSASSNSSSTNNITVTTTINT